MQVAARQLNGNGRRFQGSGVALSDIARRRTRRPSVAPSDVIYATLRSAEQLGRDVADVPIVVIAHALGVSRSTLLRQLGGSRRALDDAVRDLGVDPGGRAHRCGHGPWRRAATLIGSGGVASATLEAIVPCPWGWWRNADAVHTPGMPRRTSRPHTAGVSGEPGGARRRAAVWSTVKSSTVNPPGTAERVGAGLTRSPWPWAASSAHNSPEPYAESVSTVTGWSSLASRPMPTAASPLPVPLALLNVQTVMIPVSDSIAMWP